MTLKRGSDRIRAFSRKPFRPWEGVQVKDGRWYPARILAFDQNSGLHRVLYGRKMQWEGLFFHDDLRVRPGGTP